MSWYEFLSLASSLEWCGFVCEWVCEVLCTWCPQGLDCSSFSVFHFFPSWKPSSISAEGAVWLLRAEEAACSFSQSQLQVTFSDEEHDDTLPTFKPQEGWPGIDYRLIVKLAPQPPTHPLGHPPSTILPLWCSNPIHLLMNPSIPSKCEGTVEIRFSIGANGTVFLHAGSLLTAACVCVYARVIVWVCVRVCVCMFPHPYNKLLSFQRNSP